MFWQKVRRHRINIQCQEHEAETNICINIQKPFSGSPILSLYQKLLIWCQLLTARFLVGIEHVLVKNSSLWSHKFLLFSPLNVYSRPDNPTAQSTAFHLWHCRGRPWLCLDALIWEGSFKMHSKNQRGKYLLTWLALLCPPRILIHQQKKSFRKNIRQWSHRCAWKHVFPQNTGLPSLGDHHCSQAPVGVYIRFGNCSTEERGWVQSVSFPPLKIQKYFSWRTLYLGIQQRAMLTSEKKKEPQGRLITALLKNVRQLLPPTVKESE